MSARPYLEGRAVTSLALETCGGAEGGGRVDSVYEGRGGPGGAEVESRLIEAFTSHFGYHDVYLDRIDTATTVHALM
jgi:hypothetical protein